MLLQNDPILNTFLNRLIDSTTSGESIPMDAYRRDNDVWVHMDLPGISSETIDICVERNILTVNGERAVHRQNGDQVYLSDRKSGKFKRQVHLGESLDTEDIEADYQDGVLTLRIPIAEKAMPKKVKVNVGKKTIEASTAE